MASSIAGDSNAASPTVWKDSNSSRESPARVAANREAAQRCAMNDQHAEERAFYPAVEKYFSNHGMNKTCSEHRFEDLALLTADVVAWRGDDTKAKPLAVCEVKLYPYPVGSAGYGAIGQALALRKYAETVYVACVTSASTQSSRTWRKASETRTMRRLLSHCRIRQPENFDDYLGAARRVFEHFYCDLGLGFLVIHDDEAGHRARVLVEPARAT